MLTNIYYSNLYKTYLFAPQKTSSFSAVKEKSLQKESNPENTVLLNSSYKNEVASFANDLFKTVLGTKDAALDLANNVETFAEVSQEDGTEEAKAWLKEDLRNFAQKFNDLSKFSAVQTHSSVLKSLVSENKALLGFASGSKVFSDNDGEVEIDEKAVDNAFETGNADQVLFEVRELAKSVYQTSVNFLKRPMSEHMKFKNLSYYYNYKIGKFSENSFAQIQSGMIIDRQI